MLKRRSALVAIVALLVPVLASQSQNVVVQASDVLPEPRTDPRIKQLRDTINMLVRAESTLSAQLLDAKVIQQADQISSSSILAFDKYAFATINLNRLGRVQVTVKRLDGGLTRVINSMTFATTHVVRIPDLDPQRDYGVEIDILKNTVTLTPSGVRQQGSDQNAKDFIARLKFSTTSPMTAPQLSSDPAKTTPTSAVISVTSDAPSLFQMEVYTATRALMRQNLVKVVGAAFVVDPATQAPTTLPMSTTEVLTAAGLDPGRPYRYVIKAMNAAGQVTTMSEGGFSTPDQPTPLKFVGPLEIRIDPTAGLKVSWTASVTPRKASITALFPKTSSADTASFPSSMTPTSKDVSLTVGSDDLLKAALRVNSVPVIRVAMEDDNGTVAEMSFSVAIQVSKQAAAALPNGDLKNATNTLADLAAGLQKKIKWSDIATSTLKILPVLLK